MVTDKLACPLGNQSVECTQSHINLLVHYLININLLVHYMINLSIIHKHMITGLLSSLHDVQSAEHTHMTNNLASSHLPPFQILNTQIHPQPDFHNHV